MEKGIGLRVRKWGKGSRRVKGGEKGDGLGLRKGEGLRVGKGRRVEAGKRGRVKVEKKRRVKGLKREKCLKLENWGKIGKG